MWERFKRLFSVETQPAAPAADFEEAFASLRADCPGAAFIFARTLHNARAVVDRDDLTVQQKIRDIDKEIGRARMVSSSDGGITVMGLQTVRRMLAASEEQPDQAFAYHAVFETIARHGAAYREMQAEDEATPTIPGVARTLGKHKSPADLVRSVEADYTRMTASAEDAEARERLQRQLEIDRWTLLAMFDLRQEAQSHEIDIAMGRMRKLVRP
ncbi:MAG: hypothetical protein H6883_14380 [Rhodobiaceae bacterium]|nr:hypothetical protein [Rhodobiaceae bacterium]MCC0057304.1 hypothetical protein [Rhodobiaceae bacterium]